MKKVVLAVLFLIIGILIYPSYKTITILKENNRLKAVIMSYKKDNEIAKNSNLEKAKQIDTLKEEKKEKWEELETWQKMKTKIEKALSS